MLTASFTEITNALSEPHFLLASDGSIICSNEAAKKQFPMVTAGDALNLNMLINDGPARVHELLSMWSRSKSPLPAGVTFNIGGDAPVHYLCKGNVIRPALHGESALIMMHCTDRHQSTAAFVTLNEKIEQLQREVIERRNAEQAVRNLNLSLEQLVNDRTAELQKTNSELSRSLEDLKNAQSCLVRTERLASLGRMVAGVAHEINSPVGVCVTAASHLEEQTNYYHKRYREGTLTREDFESFLNVSSESFNIILSNLGRAADLVRSFKQLAVDQTSDECRYINMKSYISELLVSLYPYFRNTSYSYELNCPEGINIDSHPGAIAQIISNLISNSITHGFEGVTEGRIIIEVAREQDQVLLHYSDNGIGISEDHLRQIFDPFFTTKRNQGGSGLGMNIVYNLVTGKLGGDISVSSEWQQGAHFYIHWPVSAAAQKP